MTKSRVLTNTATKTQTMTFELHSTLNKKNLNKTKDVSKKTKLIEPVTGTKKVDNGVSTVIDSNGNYQKQNKGTMRAGEKDFVVDVFNRGLQRHFCQSLCNFIITALSLNFFI